MQGRDVGVGWITSRALSGLLGEDFGASNWLVLDCGKNQKPDVDERKWDYLSTPGGAER